jgi:acetyl esterase/lipase
MAHQMGCGPGSASHDIRLDPETAMMCLLNASILVLAATCFVDALKDQEPGSDAQRIALWNGHAPVGGGKFEKGEAWITVHRPAKSNGTAIVICPGGGYGVLVSGPEGHGIAEWLNRHGITGVVLEYRLPAGRPFVPLLDAQRALRTVRANAKAWGIDPMRIGIMGFSAGGHLASTAATHFDDGNPDAVDPIDRVGCRPDFAVLVYPVITMTGKGHRGSRNNLLGKEPSAKMVELFSNEKQVTTRTPPTFLAHARDDKVVPPENSKAFYEALQAQKVPSEYLELASGGHGLNGYKGPMWDKWQEQSLAWLVRLGFTPATSSREE